MSDCLSKLKKAVKEMNIERISIGIDAIVGILDACDSRCEDCLMSCEKNRVEIHALYDRMKAEGCPIDDNMKATMDYVDKDVAQRAGIACTHYETCYLGKRSVALVKAICEAFQAGNVERRKEVGRAGEGDLRGVPGRECRTAEGGSEVKHIEELGISPYPWEVRVVGDKQFPVVMSADGLALNHITGVWCLRDALLVKESPALYEYLVRTVGQLEYTLDWCTGISEAAENNARLVVEHAKEVLARVAGEEVAHDRR